MNKTKRMLEFIKIHKKLTTGQLNQWGAENYLSSWARRARELRQKKLINIRPMTPEEKVLYRAKSGAFIYEIVERPESISFVASRLNEGQNVGGLGNGRSPNSSADTGQAVFEF